MEPDTAPPSDAGNALPYVSKKNPLDFFKDLPEVIPEGTRDY